MTRPATRCTCDQSVPLIRGDHHIHACPMWADHDSLEDYVAIEQHVMKTAGAYVYDRAYQYVSSSGIHAALCEIAYALQQGDAIPAERHGELDDIHGKVPRPKTVALRRSFRRRKSR